MRNNILIDFILAIAVAMMGLILPVSYSHAGDNPEAANTLIQKIMSAYGGKDVLLTSLRTLRCQGISRSCFRMMRGRTSVL